MSRTANIFQHIICIGIAIVFMFLAIINVIFVSEEKLLKYFMIAITFVVLLVVLCKHIRISEKQFLCMFIIGSLVGKVAIALVVDARPVSDFQNMFDAARQVAEGDFSFQNNPYYYYHYYDTLFRFKFFCCEIISCVFLFQALTKASL